MAASPRLLNVALWVIGVLPKCRMMCLSAAIRPSVPNPRGTSQFLSSVCGFGRYQGLVQIVF